MSVEVEIARLLEVAQGLGTTPMLLSTDADGRPRCAATSVEVTGDVAVARVGRRSLVNAAQRPLVSLLWPAPPGERMALLVDGEVIGVEPEEPESESESRAEPGPASEPAARRGGKGGGGVVRIALSRGILHVVRHS